MNSSSNGLLSSIYTTLYEHIHRATNGKVTWALFNVGVCAILFILVSLIRPLLVQKSTPKQKTKLPKQRELGTWTPVDFKTPKPSPYPNWDIETTQPLPYRAFKHNYKVNMGIRNMDWDNWIELDNQWMKFHNDKINRIEEKGKELYETSDEAIDAAYELCEEFRMWLPERYPKLFKRTALGVDNLVTGEKHIFMLKNKGKFGRSNGEDPILIAAKMVQDDLAIMLESDTGEYYLKSGAIMLAGFWRFRDKYNMPLSTIHTSGDVPKYQTNLRPGMEKFFLRLGCDKPVVRNNYFIQTDDDLPWSRSIGEENNSTVGWYTAEQASKIDQIYFRSERQSLRRLPRSGGVVFTIRTYFLPITEICKEPHVPRRLYNGMVSWEDDVAEYKGYEKYKDVVLPYLEEKAKEQENMGITMENEKSSYPY